MTNSLTQAKKTLRYLLRDVINTASKAAFTPPPLDQEQQKLLAELRTNGLVMMPVEKLLDEREWADYQTDIHSFLANPAILAARQTYLESTITIEQDEIYANKTYLVYGTRINDGFMRSCPLKNLKNNAFIRPIIDNYYCQRTKLVYVDYWLTLTALDPARDLYSQAWHCDPEGDKIIKLFIYFTDVDEHNGALQYIKGSHPGGRHAAQLTGIKRHKRFYPGKKFVDATFPPEDIVHAKAPQGTLVICDTRGLHRGGKCLATERVMGVLEFLDVGSAALGI